MGMILGLRPRNVEGRDDVGFSQDVGIRDAYHGNCHVSPLDN